jgi:uncharacterized protein DUF1203
MTMAGFTVSALPTAKLERIRSRGEDDFGNPFEVVVNQSNHGTPLRCCLREAEPGERVALIAYQPSDRGGPYAEVGPIFVHAEQCDGYPDLFAYPKGFRHRHQLFRAFDADGRQVHNEIVEPADVDSAISRLLERPEVDVIHSRNVLPGCYMFTIKRAPVRSFRETEKHQ